MSFRNIVSKVNTWLWSQEADRQDIQAAEDLDVQIILPDGMEFRAWPKTARFLRDIIITEKLDGTNAAILITRQSFGTALEYTYDGSPPDGVLAIVSGPIGDDGTPDVEYWVAAQYRNRLLSLDKDNQGFAKWVTRNLSTLIRDLGVGRHYGEFWGNKIGRGYGLPEGDQRFSLFNPSFFDGRTEVTDGGVLVMFEPHTPGLSTVPVLYHGPLDTKAVSNVLADLQANGSRAVVGYSKPEGVIVFHTHANRIIGKVTLDNQDAGKWEQ